MKKMYVAALLTFCAGGFPNSQAEEVAQTDKVLHMHVQLMDSNRGVDDKLFLDPYIHSQLTELSGKSLLDAGCMATDCALAAAQNGAQVYGVEFQKSSIEKTQVAIAKAGVEKQISLFEGSAEKFPFEKDMFDLVLSLGVGGFLEQTQHTHSEDSFLVSGLDSHFKELARVLKEGGSAFVAAPASLDVIFTYSGSDEREVKKQIEEVLTKIGTSDDQETIKAALCDLKQVLRATFVRREGKLVLVSDVNELKGGEPIWRKVPGGAEQNFYHTDEDYLIGFQNAGLSCQEIKRPCFHGSVKYHQHRSSMKGNEKVLGGSYAEHHPFTIFYVTKKA